MSKELKRIRNSLNRDLKTLNIKIPDLALKMWSREVYGMRYNTLKEVKKRVNEQENKDIPNNLQTTTKARLIGWNEALETIKEWLNKELNKQR